MFVNFKWFSETGASIFFPIIVNPGISDHSIILADCDLKATINKKPPRKVYQWSKADWQLIKEHTVIFAKQFLALALTRTVKENYTFFLNTWKKS